MSDSDQIIQNIEAILGTEIPNTTKIAAIRDLVSEDSNNGGRDASSRSKGRGGGRGKVYGGGSDRNGGSNRRRRDPHAGSDYTSVEPASQLMPNSDIVDQIRKIFEESSTTEMLGSKLGIELHRAKIKLPAKTKLGKFLLANGFKDKGDLGNKTYILPQSSAKVEADVDIAAAAAPADAAVVEASVDDW